MIIRAKRAYRIKNIFHCALSEVLFIVLYIRDERVG